MVQCGVTVPVLPTVPCVACKQVLHLAVYQWFEDLALSKPHSKLFGSCAVIKDGKKESGLALLVEW